MAIDRIHNSAVRIGPRLDLEVPRPSAKASPDFQSLLSDFIREVNELQQDAGEAVQRLASGESTEIHDVMIAVEKAGVSFELMMEIRNKLFEAYQELMRTQM